MLSRSGCEQSTLDGGNAISQSLNSRIIRSAIVCLAVSLITACQSPPTLQSTVGRASRTTHTLRQEPHRAAICIARNVDRDKSGYIARIRQGTAPALVEVDVRAQEPIALAQLLVSGDGTTAVIWMTANPVYRGEELIAAMIEGC